MKKIFMLIVLAITLSGCRITTKMYTFYGNPLNFIPNREYEYMEYMSLGTSYMAPKYQFKKNSPVSYLTISKKYKVTEKIEILNDKVKIIYKGEEYYADVSPTKRAIRLYDSGLRINEDFIVYLGKVRITLIDGEIKIIEFPPLKFRKYIDVSKFNPILGGLNIDTQKTIYRGPLEDYKKKK